MKCFIYCRKSQEAEDRQVMSLRDQKNEVARLADGSTGLIIVDRFEEAMSAKQPGRPVFNQMMQRIERGEAECIISWHPDRLSRNPIDAGRVIYLLDQGKLKDLRFCAYKFDNTAEGKLMLNVVLSFSKYYSDNLSVNVRRALDGKIKDGWLPGIAPIGYRNCPKTRKILPDGKHFRAVQKMFQLLLSGQYTVPQIHRIVVDEWGYTTPVRKSRGGKPPSRSNVYRILTNPFYAGYVPWKGQLYPGKHQPTISKADFDRAQQRLRQPDKPRPKNLSFSYSGVFTCGACGLAITAERKRKLSGREYVYYHCTRVHRSPKCTQPSIEGRELDRQVRTFVSTITLPKPCTAWLTKEVRASTEKLTNASAEVVKRFTKQVTSLKQQIANLTDLRVRELVTDNEFTDKRETLKREVAKVEENAAKAEKERITFEPLEILQILLNRASYWLTAIDAQAKRDLLKILCSNPMIRDKKAILIARKPFLALGQLACLSQRRGVRTDVRTTTPVSDTEHSVGIRKLATLAADPETKEIAEKARKLIERIEPSLLTEFYARDDLANRL